MRATFLFACAFLSAIIYAEAPDGTEGNTALADRRTFDF
jgi:hypothetical protein